MPEAATASDFEGFGVDAIGFLAGLADDNSKQYFTEHRAVYDEQVVGPLRSFVVAVGNRLRDVVPPLQYESKVGRSMFRINRDLRFGNDPTPYHTHLDVVWWQGEHPRTSPSFICRVRPDGVRFGAGVRGLKGRQLDSYRRAVDEPSGVDLVSIVDEITARFPTAAPSEPSRARVPRPFSADHPRGEWLRRDGFHVSASEALPDVVTSAAFADWVAGRLTVFVPLHQWLVSAVEPDG